MASDYDNSGPAPQLQKLFVHNSTELGIQDHINEPLTSKLVPNVVPSVDISDTSQQELDLLFSPLYEEYFTAGNQSVSKSFALLDNSPQQDIQPPLNVQPIIELIIQKTTIHAKENNNDQEADA
ncbi:hypothetical protein Tco_0303797 [Tanacetum coccineum]